MLDPLGDKEALSPKCSRCHRGPGKGTLKISTGEYGSQHRCLALLEGSTNPEDFLEEVTGMTLVWQCTAKYHAIAGFLF